MLCLNRDALVHLSAGIAKFSFYAPSEFGGLILLLTLLPSTPLSLSPSRPFLAKWPNYILGTLGALRWPRRPRRAAARALWLIKARERGGRGRQTGKVTHSANELRGLFH